MSLSKMNRVARKLFWLQGIYFAVTGFWPIVNISSFIAVTGPKQDLWLVQTVGVILTVIGIVFCVAGSTRVHIGAAPVVLAVGSAVALLAVDVVFTSVGAIGPIYLCDAAAELGLLIAWGTMGYLLRRDQRRRPFHVAMAWQ